MKRENQSGNWTYFQTSNPLISKLNFDKSKKISFLKEISRLNSTLRVRDNKIVAVAGDNEEQFNENTISLIAFKYSKMLKESLPQEKLSVIVAHDEDEKSHLFSSIFSTALAHYGIEVHNFSQNHAAPYPLAFFSLNYTKTENMIYFSKKNSVTELYTIVFKNVKNQTFTEKETDSLNSTIELEQINKKNIYSKSVVKYFDNQIFDSYANYLLSINSINKSKDFSFSFLAQSNSHRHFLDEVFRRSNYVFQKGEIKTRNKILKETLEQEWKDSRVLSYLGRKIKREKSDLGFVFSNDGTEMSCLVKHKSLIKYLNYASLAILYTHYLKLSGAKQVSFYRSKSTFANIDQFTKKIPGSTMSIFQSRRNILEAAGKKKKKDFLFGFDEESKYFISRGKPMSGFDPITFALAILEMAVYFKQLGKDLFQVFEELEAENGILRQGTETIISNKEEALNLFTRLWNVKEINGKKVVNKERFSIQRNFTTMILILIDGTQIIIKYNGFQNLLTYFVSIKPEKIHFSIVATIEKEIIMEINSMKENSEPKKNPRKSIIKYALSSAFLILIFYLMFSFVYSKKGSGAIDGIFIIKDAWAVFSQSYVVRVYFILIASSLFFYSFFNSWTIYVMMKKQKIRIKFRHLFISAFIAICVSNATPLYIGGDLASFWYLKRKGYNTAALAATFLASSFIYQITMVVMSLILIPFMFTMFGFIFSLETTEASFLMILLIAGISINTLAVLLSWIIANWKWLQVKIVSLITYAIEFFPYAFVLDPRKKSGLKYYGFAKTRKGFRKILKAPVVFLGVFGIRLIVSFISFSPFIAMIMGILKPDLQGGPYWYLLVSNNIVRAINSISITPGGVGTADAILLYVTQSSFLEGEALNQVFRERGINVFFKDGTKIYAFLNQVMFYIFPTLISACAFLTVWLGEKRLDKYRKIAINQSLSLNKDTILMSKRDKTHFFKIATAVWVIGTIGFLTLLMLA